MSEWTKMVIQPEGLEPANANVFPAVASLPDSRKYVCVCRLKGLWTVVKPKIAYFMVLSTQNTNLRSNSDSKYGNCIGIWRLYVFSNSSLIRFHTIISSQLHQPPRLQLALCHFGGGNKNWSYIYKVRVGATLCMELITVCDNKFSHFLLTGTPSSPRSPLEPAEPSGPWGPFRPELPCPPASPDGPYKHKDLLYFGECKFYICWGRV